MTGGAQGHREGEEEGGVMGPERDGVRERIRNMKDEVNAMTQEEVEELRGELQGLRGTIEAKLNPIEYGRIDPSLLRGRNV